MVKYCSLLYFVQLWQIYQTFTGNWVWKTTSWTNVMPPPFNNYIFFLCALLNIKYIFLLLLYFYLKKQNKKTINMSERKLEFSSVSKQLLLLVLQVQSQRSKLTSLSPASDLFQMLKWYVNHTDLLKHRCTGCHTHAIVSTRVYTWNAHVWTQKATRRVFPTTPCI